MKTSLACLSDVPCLQYRVLAVHEVIFAVELFVLHSQSPCTVEMDHLEGVDVEGVV